MALYKYVTIDTLKKIIAGSIRFTQPSAFNDPFEMLPELYIPESFGKVELHIKFDIVSQRREPNIGELKVDFESDNCNDIVSRKILATLNKSIGILCLSKNPNSLLMWSHYANEYAGAMIEFNEDHDFFQGEIAVDYRDYRPKKDISAYINDGQLVPIAELCVKPRQWEYESEVRIIRCLSSCKKVSNESSKIKFPIFVMDIPKECINGVTIGERTPILEQRQIWELLKNTKIAMSLAAISNWGYEFRNEIIKFNLPISEMSPVISPRTAHIFSAHSCSLGELARWAIKNGTMTEIVNNTV